jgi:predicted amidophosphoribosyltransferase
MGREAPCGRCTAAVPPGARFCPGCGAPVTGGQAAEERKLATALFADPVGSTALAGSR